MPNKHPVICAHCDYSWSTRCQDPEKIICPKCKFIGVSQLITPRTQADVGCFLAPIPPGKPKDNGHDNYGFAEVNRYIKHLGCWGFVNPADAIKRRDPNDYRECLEQLIRVNKTRKDQVGRWEIAAARKALKGLGQ